MPFCLSPQSGVHLDTATKQRVALPCQCQAPSSMDRKNPRRSTSFPIGFLTVNFIGSLMLIFPPVGDQGAIRITIWCFSRVFASCARGPGAHPQAQVLPGGGKREEFPLG